MARTSNSTLAGTVVSLSSTRMALEARFSSMVAELSFAVTSALTTSYSATATVTVESSHVSGTALVTGVVQAL